MGFLQYHFHSKHYYTHFSEFNFDLERNVKVYLTTRDSRGYVHLAC